jgi:two-component system phosphate regulon sensor histidine kinase PhoR
MARASGSSGWRGLAGAGGRAAALRDGLLLAGAGLVPAAFAVTLGLRAVRGEEAAVRREAVAETERAAQQAEASVTGALREAEGRLAAAASETVPPSVSEMRAYAAKLAPAWAEPLVLDTRLEPLGAAVEAPTTTVAAGRTTASCLASLAELRAGTATPRRALEGCDAARTELGAWLSPLALLEVLRERPDDVAAGMLVTWLGNHASRLRSAERAATMEEIRASRMTAAQRGAALLALERGDAASSRIAASLRSDAARVALARGPDAGGLIRWRGDGSVGALLPLPKGGALGFVVDAAALGRATDALPSGTSTRLRVVEAVPPRTEAPRAVAWLAPGLGLEATLAGGHDLASRTRRARFSLWAVASASVAVALGFAVAFFARLRGARRTSELRTSFAAAVSHELRTPIASIRMLAELLEEGRAGEEAEQQETAGAIARESRRLGETVARLLAWSRMREGRSELDRSRVDLGEVVGDAVDVFIERHPDADVARALEESVEVSVDAALVQLAVMNLLENARKYAPEGGPYRVGVARTGGGARISVEDAGPGVPGAMRARIFEAFERGDDRLSRATEGTGIGLALVRAVARAHGGEASVRDGRGGGATFVMELRDDKERAR